MAKVIPTRWRVQPALDTRKPNVAEYPIRHAPQGFIAGLGWHGIATNDGDILSFPSHAEAQAWIDDRVRAAAQEQPHVLS